MALIVSSTEVARPVQETFAYVTDPRTMPEWQQGCVRGRLDGAQVLRRLGWPLVLDTDDFVVFELRGALLALFGTDDLGRDAHALPERGGIRSSIIITANRPEDWTS